MMRRDKINWWLLLGVMVLTLLPFLGECLFNTKGEAREAIVAFSMLESGDWILPTYYGGDIQFKPPLLYWCIAALSWMLGGEVTEFLSRLPSAIAAIAMVMTGYTLYRKPSGDATRRGADAVALAMAALTFTTFEVNRAATSCRLDMLVTAFIVTSIYALYRFTESRQRRYALLAVVLMACGALTKGPVGVGLPCMVIVLYRWIRGGGFNRAFWPIAGLGALAMLPLCAWYWGAYQRGGDDFMALMLEENIGRLTGTMSYQSHYKPLYYNFLSLLGGMMPYTIVVILSLLCVRWRKLDVGRGVFKKIREGVKSLQPLTLLSLVAVVSVFAFYCIPLSKRSVYLLPMYPFLCYFLALMFRWLADKGGWALKAFGWVIVVVSIGLPVLYFTIHTGVLSGIGGNSLRMAIDAMMCAHISVIDVLLLVVSCSAGVALIRVLLNSSPSRAFAMTVGVVISIYWTYAGVYQPQVLNARSDRPMIEALQREDSGTAGIYSYKCRLFVANFYSGDRVRDFDHSSPQTGIVILDPASLGELAARYPHISLTQLWASPAATVSGDTRTPLAAYRFAL